MDSVFGARHGRLGPAGLRESRHLVEALRVARHHQNQEPGTFRRLIEQELFLAIARAREEEHRPADLRLPLTPGGKLRGVESNVELEVARHDDVRGAERAQARGIVLALRARYGEAADAGAGE